MTTSSRTCQEPNCTVEVPVVLEIHGFCLRHYLEGAFHRLAEATQDFQSGRDVERQSMDWLLAQVDFAVQVLAQENANWDDDQRSKLLELLLGVANLNEYVSHSSAMAHH